MPDRNLGSMLCPNCGKLISTKAPKCPFCGTANPGLWGYGPALSRLFGGQIRPVSLIPKVCLVLYVVALLLDLGAALSFRGSLFGILSPSGRALYILGSTAPADLVNGRYWTLLTAIYLHGGILHILFNMLWIRNLGPEVERAFGPARFFVIWSVSGAAGFLVSNLVTGPGSIGASGSIFGLLAALIIYGRAVGASLLTRQLWQWALILGVMGFLLPGVDNLAHLGGFAGGWITATVLRSGLGQRDTRGVTVLALALLAATVLGFVLNVGRLVVALLG
jgi:rhomboid protease GluP